MEPRIKVINAEQRADIICRNEKSLWFPYRAFRRNRVSKLAWIVCPNVIPHIDQQSIMLYLRLKSMSAVAIQRNLMDTLRSDVMAYSTIAMYLREAQFRVLDKSPPADG
jgi:hypothetical protein